MFRQAAGNLIIFSLCLHNVVFSMQHLAFLKAGHSLSRTHKLAKLVKSSSTCFVNSRSPSSEKSFSTREKADTLCDAVKSGNKKLVKQFLENKNFIEERDREGNTPLLLAVERSYSEIVDLLLRANASVLAKNANNKTVLMAAAAKGQINLVRKLLNNKINVDERDNNGVTALRMAATNHQIEIVKLLLEFGADTSKVFNVPANNQRTISFRPMIKSTEIIKIFLDKLDNVNAAPVLNGAIEASSLELVQLLIERGVDPNFGNEEIQNPLIYAIDQGRHSIALFLINSGKVDINFKNNEGNTALIEAVRSRDFEIAKLLIKNKADINATNNMSKSAFYFALQNSRSQLMALLYKHGADIFNGGEPEVSKH